jgi:hypothetical protein
LCRQASASPATSSDTQIDDVLQKNSDSLRLVLYFGPFEYDGGPKDVSNGFLERT